MEYSAWAAIEVSTLLMITVCGYFYYKYKDFPPGPWGMPLLGYVLFLGAKPHVTLRDLGKKYGGGIVSVNLGNSQTVVVNNWEGIKEVLVKQGSAFSMRPYMNMFDIILQGRYDDIIATSGPVTKELKRISIQLLKEFGMGRTSLESVVVEEVEKLAAHLKTKDGQLVDVSSICFIPITNIVWGIVSGKKYAIDDPEMKFFADSIHVLANLNNGALLSIFPAMRFIAPELSGYTKMNNASKNVYGYVEKVVKEHLKEGDNDQASNQTDFIHGFNEEIKKRKKENKDQPPYCINNLIGATHDLFGAGIETTDTTLWWAFILMAYHPDIQEKVQRELDERIAKESLLSYASKLTIPYTEATLLEVHRFATIVPLSLPHCAAKDATLLGYKIPKGTTVLTNLWALHHDKEYWGDPETFRPERFLDEEGRLAKNEHLMTFGAGPRMCLGEPLAKMELTLFFSCLLRRFSFQKDPTSSNSNKSLSDLLEPKVGFTLKPCLKSLIVKCR